MGGEIDNETLTAAIRAELDSDKSSPLRRKIGQRRVMWQLMLRRSARWMVGWSVLRWGWAYSDWEFRWGWGGSKN
jgi:hypothetical protein